MADSEGPRDRGARGVTGRPPRRGLRLAGSLMFAALLALVAALLVQPAGGFGLGAAHAAPIETSPSASPSVSPSPTATTPAPTATPLPPTLTIVSPGTGRGPVGAHVTVSGQNFSGSSAQIFASQQKDCGGTPTPLASASVSGGTLTQPFIWPTSLSGVGETFFICGTGMTSGAPGFLVLSSSQPTLKLSVATIQVGQPLTISGQYFLGLPGGSQVTIFTKTPGGSTTTLTTAVVGDDGTFQAQWTAAGSAGDITIQAQSAPENSAPPALQAQATVTILAGSPTATGSPTSSATAATGGGHTSTGQTGDNTGLVILLVVGIVLLLLVILVVVAFLLLKGKGGPPGPGGGRDDGYPTGAYPGYAERNRVPATVPPSGMTGRQAVPDQFGRSGFYDGTTAGMPAGGVSQWDDPEPGPDAGWQPRPMTGYGRAYGAPGYPDGGYDEGPTNPSALDQGGGYGPADPWQDAGAQFGGLPRLEGDGDEWGGATRASDPAVNPRRPADGLGDARQGGRDQYPFPRGSGGMGDTNPAGGDGGW